MTNEEILQIQGIVVRYIPDKTVRLWDNGTKQITGVKDNKLKGYAITFNDSQDKIIIFSKNNTGFGASIQEAYADYLNKIQK